MLTSELINHNIPQLQLNDSVGKALQLINDFKLNHLPVVSEDHFLGLISEDDLLDAPGDQILLEALVDSFKVAFVKDTDHFLNAVNVSNAHDTMVVPVVTATNEFVGVITVNDLLKTLGNFAGATEIGGIIVLELAQNQFTLSEISRIVESNDARILHLNTTIQPETGMLLVTLHINKREIASIVGTFERYEYHIVFYHGDEKFENETEFNFKNLMNYLGM